MKEAGSSQFSQCSLASTEELPVLPLIPVCMCVCVCVPHFSTKLAAFCHRLAAQP